jgi:hypothetical protein
MQSSWRCFCEMSLRLKHLSIEPGKNAIRCVMTQISHDKPIQDS